MKKCAMLLILVLIVLGAVSSSYGEYRAIFKNKKMAEELKLSDKQVETIKDIVKNTEKKMIQLRADKEIKEIDLRDMLDEDDPDEANAVALVKDIMAIQTEERVLKIKELIRIKKTLTPEQIEKFHEIRQEHRMGRKHMKEGAKGRMGPPEHEGPPK